MWTDVFGSTAATLCRSYNGIFGSFPTACLVNAGYPALVLGAAIVVGIVLVASLAWRKLRRKG